MRRTATGASGAGGAPDAVLMPSGNQIAAARVLALVVAVSEGASCGHDVTCMSAQ